MISSTYPTYKTAVINAQDRNLRTAILDSCTQKALTEGRGELGKNVYDCNTLRKPMATENEQRAAGAHSTGAQTTHDRRSMVDE